MMCVENVADKATKALFADEVDIGKRISDKAEEFGLVNYAVDADDVFEKSMELAREITSAAPLAVRWTKRSAYDNLNWDIHRAAGREAQLQSQSMTTKDFREGVSALLEKRDPDFKCR